MNTVLLRASPAPASAEPSEVAANDDALASAAAVAIRCRRQPHHSRLPPRQELDLYASYGAKFNDDWSWRVGPNSTHDCGDTRGFVMLQATF